MTLHLKSKGYPFRPRLLFSSFIVVGVGFPTVYYFRRGQVLIVSSFLQNDLPDAPLKSFHWTAITIYNASALHSLLDN